MPQDDTSAPAPSGDLDAVAKHAAALAVSDAEELMEAVTTEAIRMLRDELRGEITEVVESMRKLESIHEGNKQEVAEQQQVVTPKDLKVIKDKVSTMGNEVHALQAKLSQQQVAQWKNANKEQVEKQISDLHELLLQTKAEIAQHAPKVHVDKQIADLQARLGQVKDESTQDQLLEMKAQMQELHTELSGRSVQPDSITRSDLEAVSETAKSALRAQEVASKEHVDRHVSDLHELVLQTKGEIAQAIEHVDKQIADLQTRLGQVKDEGTQDQLLEMKAQMQELHTQLSGRSVQPDSITRSDLEVISETAMSALRAQEVASKEHVDRHVSDLHELLLQTKGEIAQAIEHVDKQIADLQTRLGQVKDESTQDQLLEMKAQMQELHTELSGRSVQPDSITRSDLEAIKETTMSALRAQEVASKEHVDQHIYHLRTDLSQIKEEQKSSLSELRGAAKDDVKTEPANENLSEMKGQMQAMQMQLSEFKGVSDLEDMKSQMQQMQQMQKKLSLELESRSDVEAIKHVDQKISDVQAHLLKIKIEHEATASELRGHGIATKENVNKQISELNSYMHDIRENLAQPIDKHLVTRAELDAMRDYFVGETSNFRKLSDSIPPQVQNELNALNGHVADIRKQTGQMQAEVELKDVQREMDAHLNELREVVDKLVKGSSKEALFARMSTLEHDIDELRSEATSLNMRIAMNSEQQRATQAQQRAEDQGVFCNLFQVSI